MRALIFFFFPSCHCLSVSQLFTHSLTHPEPGLTGDQPTKTLTRPVTSVFVSLMNLHIPRILQKEINSDPDPGVFCTFVVTVDGAGVITSLWEFFTHFFGLILQSLLKPICFAHLIGNLAFILIAAQFKCGLRQITLGCERA